jgi:lysyl-tRNA synthetase class 2
MTPRNPFNDGREQNLEELEDENLDPYGTVESSPSDISDFTDEYEDRDPEEDDRTWTLAGRLTRENEFGDFVFYDIRDNTGEVQVMCSVDERLDFRTDGYGNLESVNIGDIIVFTGTSGVSNTGELTLFAEEYEVASKALDEISDEWNSPTNQQQIQHRTGALASRTENLFENVRTHMDIKQEIRNLLTSRGYREFDTPILHNYAGGASATPFETYCEALDEDVYLRIAPELYLKRLIVAGYDGVFEIARSFRNESIDTTHNPEFTMLELYEQYADYQDMMDLTEDLFRHTAEQVAGDSTVEYDGIQLDFGSSWNRVKFDEGIEEVLEDNIADISSEDIRSILTDEYGLSSNEVADLSYDELLMEVFEEVVEPTLTQPTFVYNYPTASTPLCQTLPDNPDRVQRFEGFVNGVEVANSYTELTDPREQRQRLIEQAGGDENAINNEFVEALSYGMPPTAGLGIGVERMAMLLTDSQSIKDILPYPMASSRR